MKVRRIHALVHLPGRTLIPPSTNLLSHSLAFVLRNHPTHGASTRLYLSSLTPPTAKSSSSVADTVTRKWLGHTMEVLGPGGHNPEEDAQACVNLLKAKIKNVTHFSCTVINLVDGRY